MAGLDADPSRWDDASSSPDDGPLRAGRVGRLERNPKGNPAERAVEAGVLTRVELETLEHAEEARAEIVAVDSFRAEAARVAAAQ